MDGMDELAGEVTAWNDPFWLVENGHVERFAELLAGGLDPDVRDGGLRTPLHYAAYLGFEVMIGMLSDCGAETDARDADGQTPLMMAALGKSERCMLRLVALGADPFASSENGTLLIDYVEAGTMLAETVGDDEDFDV